jgi:hypothetical protein
MRRDFHIWTAASIAALSVSMDYPKAAMLAAVQGSVHQNLVTNSPDCF